jgi:Phage tail sheath protein subtilisin-like domain/Phage tail sheath C-terminal domain
MAEALISPGVFLRENDQSQITTGPITVGAALIGPTVVGRKDTPTLVTSYSEYSAKFGTTFISGGNTQEYLTSQAAYNYFQQGGTSLLVTRVTSGSYTAANASVPNFIGTSASASISSSFTVDGSALYVIAGNSGTFIATSSIELIQAGTNGFGYYYFPTGSTPSIGSTNFATALNRYSGSFGVVATSVNATASIVTIVPGTYGNAYKIISGPITQSFASGLDATYAFEIETLSVGDVMNNNQGSAAGQTVNGILPSGSSSNVRWQITQVDSGSGYFTLLVRQGNDYTQGQSVLETWTNLSLDPNQNNYIAYVIGDQSQTVKYDEGGQAYFQITGSYPNLSNYIRVANVYTPTPNYLNPQGRPYSQYTASLPLNGSGSYNGSFANATGPLYGCFTGANYAPLNLFEQIPTIPSVATTPTTNIQGVFASDYDTAINLLSNKDAYVYNSIYTPGISNQNASSQVSALLSTVQNRGDAIAVVDLVGYNQTIATVSQAAQSYDNSYGATYYPWVQVRSTETGRLHFVPASTVIPGVYEYNDKVSAEWFAPAGLNRGGLPTVIQPEIRLTVNQRNTLYSSKVNPIAVFPGQGTVVYGQKTLQARASSLDRVNVRRLLIALKGYIGQIAQTLVFEQNTAVTRNKFISQVNPYLEYVQQRQGLYAFRVVMDETNNTPDVIDRNLLVGAIYLQPTRTAEFIQLDFNILPTGVTFG